MVMQEMPPLGRGALSCRTRRCACRRGLWRHVIRMEMRRRRTGATRLTWRDRRRGRHERGQALVEFSLVLFPFLLLLLALVQFAFVFQAWITMNSALRDAARDAALYAYDKDSTQTANDLARN